MWINLLLLISGLGLVLFGSDWLVSGAVGVGRKLGWGEFVIGALIVGFGTSFPELVVSVIGAIQGSVDIALGNVVGSNIMNTLLILGSGAIILPITLEKENKNFDIPFLLVSYLFAIIFSYHGFSRLSSIILILLFAYYISRLFRKQGDMAEEEKKEMDSKSTIKKDILLVGLGILALFLGGKMFVGSGVKIAESLGWSEKFIAITVFAFGTSLPELITTIISAGKGKDQMALGNIIGSCLFNTLLILGLSSLIHPILETNVGLIDLGIMFLSGALLYLGVKKMKLDRWIGVLFVLIYLVYFGYLVYVR